MIVGEQVATRGLRGAGDRSRWWDDCGCPVLAAASAARSFWRLGRDTQSPDIITPRRAGVPDGVVQGQKQKGFAVSDVEIHWPGVRTRALFSERSC